jgi:hypothetical protein
MNFFKQLIYYAYELKISFQPMDLKFLKIQQHDSLKHIYGWLQSRVVHFLCHNLVFSRVTCFYMLLTWYKNNSFQILWLDLDFQLEEEEIYKTKLQHQIYSNGLLKLKNMD